MLPSEIAYLILNLISFAVSLLLLPLKTVYRRAAGAGTDCSTAPSNALETMHKICGNFHDFTRINCRERWIYGDFEGKKDSRNWRAIFKVFRNLLEYKLIKLEGSHDKQRKSSFATKENAKRIFSSDTSY